MRKNLEIHHKLMIMIKENKRDTAIRKETFVLVLKDVKGDLEMQEKTVRRCKEKLEGAVS